MSIYQRNKKFANIKHKTLNKVLQTKKTFVLTVFAKSWCENVSQNYNHLIHIMYFTNMCVYTHRMHKHIQVQIY